MQPKLTAKARCSDREVGKISKVIVDPLSHEISHVVVREPGGQEIHRLGSHSPQSRPCFESLSVEHAEHGRCFRGN